MTEFPPPLSMDTNVVLVLLLFLRRRQQGFFGIDVSKGCGRHLEGKRVEQRCVSTTFCRRAASGNSDEPSFRLPVDPIFARRRQLKGTKKLWRGGRILAYEMWLQYLSGLRQVWEGIGFSRSVD